LLLVVATHSPYSSSITASEAFGTTFHTHISCPLFRLKSEEGNLM
jgi:hypothetical protein